MTRAPAYRALSLALESGLDPLRTLDHDPQAAQRFKRARDQGLSLTECVEACYQPPTLELRILEAAERSGRLPEALGNLADDIETQARASRKAWARCAYPLFVLHLVPLATLSPLVITDPAQYFLQISLWVGALWALLGAGLFAHRRLLGVGAYRRILRSLPLIGSLERDGQLLRFLSALRWLHGSGLLWRDALPEAAACAAPVGVLPEIRAATEDAVRDQSMEQCLSRLAPLPNARSSELQTAAHIGGLESALVRGVEELRIKVDQHRDRLARSLGHAAYAVAVFATLAAVLRFYANYWGQLDL